MEYICLELVLKHQPICSDNAEYAEYTEYAEYAPMYFQLFMG